MKFVGTTAEDRWIPWSGVLPYLLAEADDNSHERTEASLNPDRNEGKLGEWEPDRQVDSLW